MSYVNSEILTALKALKKNSPTISGKEYWERVNKIAEEERRMFAEEDRKLRMSWDLFHKPFDI